MTTRRKKPEGSRPRVSKSALPSRLWNITRNERAMQVDGLPALRSLALELDILRALLANPTQRLLFTRHRTLANNRWIAFERVAKAAMREGYTPEDAARMLIETHAEYSSDGYRFTAECATWVVASQREPERRFVIAPATSKRGRIVGVLA